MTTSPFVPWGSLFSGNGSPLPDIGLTIHQAKIPIAESSGIIYPTEASSLLFWENDRPNKIIPAQANTEKFMEKKRSALNGRGHEYSFVGVKLPEKNSEAIRKNLRLYFNREKRRDPFGEYFWSEFKKRNQNIHCLANLIMNIRFDPVYVQDHATQTLRQLETFSARREDTGIYFIMEHAPNNPFFEIVYVGKSFNSMRTTVWCHFHEWKQKYSYCRPRGSRAEDRGRWIEKVSREGYSYSIGTIKILPAMGGFPGIHKREILDLEKKFITVFSPRDNIRDNPAVDIDQTSLFDGPVFTDAIPEISDDMPF